MEDKNSDIAIIFRTFRDNGQVGFYTYCHWSIAMDYTLNMVGRYLW